MGLFSRGQERPEPTLWASLHALEAQVKGLAVQVRDLEREQVEMHAQVRRWMRRAVAAERAVERADTTRAQGGATVVPGPEGSPARRSLWGARARIAARRGTVAASTSNGDEPEPEAEPADQGGD